jgi:hypothetical protein
VFAPPLGRTLGFMSSGANFRKSGAVGRKRESSKTQEIFCSQPRAERLDARRQETNHQGRSTRLLDRRRAHCRRSGMLREEWTLSARSVPQRIAEPTFCRHLSRARVWRAQPALHRLQRHHVQHGGCLNLNAQYGIGRQGLRCPRLFSKCGDRSGGGFVKGCTLDRHRVDRPVHRLHCYPAGPRRRHDVPEDSIVFVFYSPPLLGILCTLSFEVARAIRSGE